MIPFFPQAVNEGSHCVHRGLPGCFVTGAVPVVQQHDGAVFRFVHHPAKNFLTVNPRPVPGNYGPVDHRQVLRRRGFHHRKIPESVRRPPVHRIFSGNVTQQVFPLLQILPFFFFRQLQEVPVPEGVQSHRMPFRLHAPHQFRILLGLFRHQKEGGMDPFCF